VLNDRLAELREAGIVEPGDGGGFRLTPAGEDLLVAYRPLNDWAEAWARRKPLQ